MLDPVMGVLYVIPHIILTAFTEEAQRGYATSPRSHSF